MGTLFWMKTSLVHKDEISSIQFFVLRFPSNLALILSQVPVNVLLRRSKLIDLFLFCLVGGVQRGLPGGKEIILFLE